MTLKPVLTVAVFMLLCGAVSADDFRYPAAQCAALMLGMAEYSHDSAFFDSNPDPLTDRAAAFRAVAIRQNGGDAGPVDTAIADQRPQMTRLLDAYIVRFDDQSRDIFRRLLQTCQEVTIEYPESHRP